MSIVARRAAFIYEASCPTEEKVMDRRGFLKAGSVAAVAGIAHVASANAKEEVKAKKAAQPNYLILACDGGGMRGYLSSLIMQKLDQELNIFGNNNQGIDLYAGTSTGGLIALGLAAGKTIDDVVELYEDDGAAIFTPLAQQSPCVESLPSFLRKYKSVADLYQVDYDDISDTSVSTVLQDFIPSNPILNTLPNKVMVTTLQLAAQLSTGTSWNPLIIENLTKSAGASTHLWDAALSTSAEPI
jgi:patatin-like phospholipase/acyl hydrolase